MNCSNFRRLVSAYCDAELPAERRAAVRRHLQSCEGCRSLLDGFKDLAVLAAKWADVQPPASLWHALAPKLKAAATEARLEDLRTARAGGVGRPAPSAGAAPSAGVGRPAPSAEAAPSAGPSPKRTFKPVVEGLEDRQTLSGLLGAAGTAIAADSFASAVALLHVGEDWIASSRSAAAATFWGPIDGAMGAAGAWGPVEC